MFGSQQAKKGKKKSGKKQYGKTVETRFGSEDPVFKSVTDGKWYYWDETWGNKIGPYKDERTARIALRRYLKNIRKQEKKLKKDELALFEVALITPEGRFMKDRFRTKRSKTYVCKILKGTYGKGTKILRCEEI